jgi:hypothetical protein
LFSFTIPVFVILSVVAVYLTEIVMAASKEAQTLREEVAGYRMRIPAKWPSPDFLLSPAGSDFVSSLMHWGQHSSP